MERTLEVEVLGQALKIHTQDGLFSPERIDRGTLAMLSVVCFRTGLRALDLGCGSGVVGICAARLCGVEGVYMTDIDPVAVALARKNAAENGVPGVHVLQSDGFRELDETNFDCILSNPPYQSDFSVAKHFIEKGFNRLKLGGKLYMVTKRLDWYRNKMTGVFGGVRVHPIDGYFVFEAEKRTMQYAKAASKRAAVSKKT